jgi:hypothetical protein
MDLSLPRVCLFLSSSPKAAEQHIQLTRGQQQSSLVRVAEVLQELRDVVREHVVHRLHHLGLDLLELVDAVRGQHLFEVLDVGEVAGWKMVLPLDLFPSD